MNFDFPKNTEWILSKSTDSKKRTYYEFNIWKKEHPIPSIAYFRRKTPKQMALAIKKLCLKLRKK